MKVAQDLPGLGISRDIRVSDKRALEESERKVEEEWQVSERRHIAARREENRQEWYAYHMRAAESHRATLGALVDYHEREAAKCLVMKV